MIECCSTCGAELLLDSCPSCPIGADDPTIRIPYATMRANFAVDSTMPPALSEPFADEPSSNPPVEIVDDSPTTPPPPLECDSLDEDEPLTSPDSPSAIAKKRSDPP